MEIGHRSQVKKDPRVLISFILFSSNAGIIQESMCTIITSLKIITLKPALENRAGRQKTQNLSGITLRKSIKTFNIDNGNWTSQPGR